jgi:hypothetical protein
MKHFTIENETNNIMIHGSAKEAEALRNSERFSSEAALAKLVDDWPAARLVEIWNSLPGATPVKKFKDRSTAVSRIWKALQALGNAVPAEAAESAAEPVIETAHDDKHRRHSVQVSRVGPWRMFGAWPPLESTRICQATAFRMRGVMPEYRYSAALAPCD